MYSISSHSLSNKRDIERIFKMSFFCDQISAQLYEAISVLFLTLQKLKLKLRCKWEDLQQQELRHIL